MEYYIALLLILPYFYYIPTSYNSIVVIRNLKKSFQYSSKSVPFMKKSIKYISFIVILIQFHSFFAELEKNRDTYDSSHETGWSDITDPVKNNISEIEMRIEKIINLIFHHILVFVVSVCISVSSFLAGYLIYNDCIIKKFIYDQMEKETLENLQGESVYLLKIVKYHMNEYSHLILFLYNGAFTIIYILNNFYRHNNLLKANIILHFLTAIWILFINLSNTSQISKGKELKSKKKRLAPTEQSFKFDFINFNLNTVRANSVGRKNKDTELQDFSTLPKTRSFYKINKQNKDLEEDQNKDLNESLLNKDNKDIFEPLPNHMKLPDDSFIKEATNEKIELIKFLKEPIIQIELVSKQFDIYQYKLNEDFNSIHCYRKINKSLILKEIFIKLIIKHKGKETEIKRSLYDFYLLENLIFLKIFTGGNEKKKCGICGKSKSQKYLLKIDDINNKDIKDDEEKKIGINKLTSMSKKVSQKTLMFFDNGIANLSSFNNNLTQGINGFQAIQNKQDDQNFSKDWAPILNLTQSTSQIQTNPLNKNQHRRQQSELNLAILAQINDTNNFNNLRDIKGLISTTKLNNGINGNNREENKCVNNTSIESQLLKKRAGKQNLIIFSEEINNFNNFNNNSPSKNNIQMPSNLPEPRLTTFFQQSIKQKKIKSSIEKFKKTVIDKSYKKNTLSNKFKETCNCIEIKSNHLDNEFSSFAEFIINFYEKINEIDNEEFSIFELHKIKADIFKKNGISELPDHKVINKLAFLDFVIEKFAEFFQSLLSKEYVLNESFFKRFLNIN